MEINIQGKSAEEIFKLLDLKEHSVYEVQVMTSKNNVKHYTYLFTGFKTGGYCEIYKNTYDRVIKMQEVYSIGKVKFLHTQKETFVLSKDKPSPLPDFHKDMEEWENSFYCNCGEDAIEDFTYERTVANGEVWDCKNCGAELLVREQPNEDNY